MGKFARVSFSPFPLIVETDLVYVPDSFKSRTQQCAVQFAA